MTQLVVTPTIDSWMSQKNADTNHGSSVSIVLGVLFAGGAKDDTRRAIANFDVSAIPPSATIDQVSMERSITLADSREHSVHIDRCTRPTTWTENGVTWNKYDGVNNWILGGGEYDGSNPQEVAFIETTVTGIFTVSGLAQFVRDALDNRAGIVSLIMRNTDEAPPNSQRSAWLAQSFWKLIIDYTAAGSTPPQEPRRNDPISVSGRRPRGPRRPVPAQRPSSGRRPNAPTKGRTP